ncbi:hypothetical protein [Caulobacter sp. S45]|uniref:hypothetical protein n=1 Tax=Caulobacter sp. S45 TaxID=1641861 RepID=UPI0015773A0F|nr:hypothetical protein [Caulobacter sp. S45]
MLALALAAAVTLADLQHWIDDQPAVATYEQQRLTARPPSEDAFRNAPALPRPIACRGSRSAMSAAVVLFKAADGDAISLGEPELQAKNDGEPLLKLSDPAKQALEERGRRYELDAGLYEPACLG